MYISRMQNLLKQLLNISIKYQEGFNIADIQQSSTNTYKYYCSPDLDHCWGSSTLIFKLLYAHCLINFANIFENWTHVMVFMPKATTQTQ